MRGRSPFGVAKARPSTSFLREWNKDVDARHKAGHDELTEVPNFIGYIMSQALRSRASGVSKDAGPSGTSWFETALTRLLTMRVTSFPLPHADLPSPGNGLNLRRFAHFPIDGTRAR